MGVKVWNMELVCDHATPERASMVRLHLDLPVSASELAGLHQELLQGHWSALRQLLLQRYPQHREAIEALIAQSRQRSGSDLRQAENA